MNRVAEASGAKLVCGNHENDYREVDVPLGKKLKKAKIHRLILDSDVLGYGKWQFEPLIFTNKH